MPDLLIINLNLGSIFWKYTKQPLKNLVVIYILNVENFWLLKDPSFLQKKAYHLYTKTQIIDKKYDTEMQTKGIKTIIKYGVAFSGKHVEIVCA